MYLITTNCNLRCYGCIQNCDKFQNEYYIDLETFRKHMKILKRSLPHLTHLCLQGGEPLLHKQIIELCKIAHKELPNVFIDIYTNGILLNTLKDNELLNLINNYNVNFYLSLYPIVDYLKTYKNQIDRFNKLNIQMNWQHSHLFFNKYTLSRQACQEEKVKKIFLNCKQQIINNPVFLIKNNYLYLCCPSIQVIQYNLVSPNENKGCIKLENLQNEEQIYNLLDNSFETCKYCGLNYFQEYGDQLTIWQKSDNLTFLEDDTFIPLSQLYLNHYKIYEKLTNETYDLGIYLKEPFFFEHIKNETSKKEFSMLLNKCYNGWLDIFIPFSKENSKNLNLIDFKQQLLSQKYIEKYNLYFISIDDDLKTQAKWFKNFALDKDINLNIYFLKGSNLYLGVKKFFEKSNIINKYFLDITNLEFLSNDLFFINYINNKKRND